MNDLQILKELEKEMNIKLDKKDSNFLPSEKIINIEELRDHFGQFENILNSYVLDDKNNIVGLIISTKTDKPLQHIFNLINLNVLILGVKSEQVPKEIAQLRDLSFLYIDGIYRIPKEIGKLKKLKCLFIRKYELLDLSPKKDLDFYSDHLVDLLYDLDELYLIDNPLSDLPKEINQLANLKSLDLRNNKLSDLPKKINQLANLKFLNLRNNKLSDLPKEINQLANLQSLDLSYNNYHTYPRKLIN